MTPNQVPDEVMDAFYASLARDECDRKAIAAALNAWPDVVDTNPNNIGHLVLQFKKVSDDA